MSSKAFCRFDASLVTCSRQVWSNSRCSRGGNAFRKRLENSQRVVAFENHDGFVAGHPVGDAGGKARLALAADAVDQDAGALSVAKGAQDALGLAPPADKLRRRGDRHPALLDVEKFLVAGITAKNASRPRRGAERAAAARAGIGSRQMPMPARGLDRRDGRATALRGARAAA